MAGSLHHLAIPSQTFCVNGHVQKMCSVDSSSSRHNSHKADGTCTPLLNKDTHVNSLFKFNLHTRKLTLSGIHRFHE
ncbi:hypothetical protein Hanom_Chr09g00809531 [Helianthus anomalus]